MTDDHEVVIVLGGASVLRNRRSFETKEMVVVHEANFVVKNEQ